MTCHLTIDSIIYSIDSYCYDKKLLKMKKEKRRNGYEEQERRRNLIENSEQSERGGRSDPKYERVGEYKVRATNTCNGEKEQGQNTEEDELERNEEEAEEEEQFKKKKKKIEEIYSK
ncbi:hypothetical protein CRE_12642 [Caenorhabditis remanei]|uniref:Uncharacterized protein n=1 Tax=Caenorhabditis remanei TaxID=31234 RepID=E3M723_CAERE|nr:hypothetical protein CRE_12642 [Caenorhabditis remanei]